MKILVTGASGQLGHELREMSRKSDHTFIFTDVRESDQTCALDITDESAVAQYLAPDIDVVVNCAAYTDVNGAETDEAAAFRINAHAPEVLAKAARKADALLIHISTDYVFDGKSEIPYTEDAAPSPLNAYGRTKLAGEKAVMESGCRYMIFRTSWLYSKVGKNFFLTIADKSSRLPQMTVVEDQVGTPTNARDLAGLIYDILDKEMTDRTGVYNYSGMGECSWCEFATEISALMGHSCNILPCRTEDYPTPAQRPSYSVLDKQKVMRTFGVDIPHWMDSLKALVAEYKSE